MKSPKAPDISTAIQLLQESYAEYGEQGEEETFRQAIARLLGGSEKITGTRKGNSQVVLDTSARSIAQSFVDLFQGQGVANYLKGLHIKQRAMLTTLTESIRRILASEDKVSPIDNGKERATPRESFKREIVSLLQQLSTMEFYNDEGMPFTMFEFVDADSPTPTLIVQKTFSGIEAEKYRINETYLSNKKTQFRIKRSDKNSDYSKRQYVEFKKLLEGIAEKEGLLHHSSNRRRFFGKNSVRVSKGSMQEELIFNNGYQMKEYLSEGDFLLLIEGLCEEVGITYEQAGSAKINYD